MLRWIRLLALGALTSVWFGEIATAQQTEPRIAFVVGNAGYGPGALPSALNDAGLVAETLRSIGFEIVEGADLSQADLVRSYREFLAKVDAGGPDTLAFVYFSGHALSFDGENFLLGVDARLERESDIPIESVRLSDLLRPLADSQARAKVLMIDAARPLPFKPQGRALARGLEAIEAPKGMLIAFSSAPGTVAPDRPGDYGAYATAIAEMLRAPGIDVETAFTHIRSRTHQSTEGQQTPWDASALGEPIELVPAAAATASAPPPPPLRQDRPMREIGPDEAYGLAIEMDTLEGYTAFVQAYPGHPYTQRVWAMIRARREALAWMRAQESNTPRSYWTYLRRYPNGMYAVAAERRLRRLGEQGGPPSGFAMMDFDDVPLALAGEPQDYEEVYRVGPPPPRGLYRGQRPAYLANMSPPQRRGRGSGNAARLLPALAVAIPVIAALAPAPRRAFTPGAGGPGRQGGSGARGGNRNRTTPASLTPNQAVAPSTVTPKATIAPSTVSPSPGSRPPGWGPGPGGPRPPGAAGQPPRRGPPPGVATGTPSAAPNSAAPNPTVTPPSTPGVRRPPAGTPAIVHRTPPAGSPTQTGVPPVRPAGAPPHVNQPPRAAPPRPAVVARPNPPAVPVAKPSPPVRPAPRPAAAAARPAPPPPRPAAAAPAKPPACPAGKSLKPVAGRMVCA